MFDEFLFFRSFGHLASATTSAACPTFGYCWMGMRTLSDSLMFLLLMTSRYFFMSPSFLSSSPSHFSISGRKKKGQNQEQQMRGRSFGHQEAPTLSSLAMADVCSFRSIHARKYQYSPSMSRMVKSCCYCRHPAIFLFRGRFFRCRGGCEQKQNRLKGANCYSQQKHPSFIRQSVKQT